MTSRDGRAGLALLEARLEGYRRYAELVRAQEAAAAAGDLDEVERLGRLRDELQERFDVGDLAGATDAAEEAADEVPDAPVPSGPPRLEVLDGGVTERERLARRMEEVRSETRRVLFETAEAHERFVGRLAGLRDETGDEARGMERRRTGIDSYVGRKADGRRGVNIRF